MSKLKHILFEDIESDKAKLALNFLKNLIKGTKYETKVYLAGGAVRDELMGKDPKISRDDVLNLIKQKIQK